MNKIIALATAGLLIGMLSFNGNAYAQVGVDVGGSASVNDTSADTDVSVDASDDDTDSNRDDADGVDDSGITAETSSETAISFSLSHDQAASASVDAESAELSAEAVVTNDDLSRFATSRMKRDANIENVSVDDGRPSVEYRKKARFLGFIPSSIRATAEVAEDGTVSIDYPWYRFLFSVDRTDDEELRAQVSEIRSHADVSAGLDAHATAELINALHAALQGSASAEIGATADVSGSASASGY